MIAIKKAFLFLMGFVIALTGMAQGVPEDPEAVINVHPQNLLNDVEVNMVRVVGGTFVMGAKDDGEYNNTPLHTVEVCDFMISRYDVTQALWTAVMGNNPSGSTKCDSCPVEKVSWYDAQEFIAKLNRLTGRYYRLPLEAEWEYAARGGRIGGDCTFSGSDEIDSVGWNDSNSDKATHPVGQKNANELGLFDMTGNVLQWCSDWYSSSYYQNSPYQSPRGPKSGRTKVLHGCAWNIYTSHCGVAVRADLTPNSRYYNVGFRIAADL